MCSFLLFRYNAILPLGRLLLYLGIAVLPLLDPERPETSKVMSVRRCNLLQPGNSMNWRTMSGSIRNRSRNSPLALSASVAASESHRWFREIGGLRAEMYA